MKKDQAYFVTSTFGIYAELIKKINEKSADNGTNSENTRMHQASFAIVTERKCVFKSVRKAIESQNFP